MAIHDERRFRYAGEEWVAQVQAQASGAEDRERLTFTYVADPSRRSKWGASIPRGTLNAIPHAEICRLLAGARDATHRAAIGSPALPTGRGPGWSILPLDEEGLRWAMLAVDDYEPDASGSPRRVTRLDLVCLDDSALRGSMPFNSSDELDDFLTYMGPGGASTFVRAIKRKMEEG